MKRFSPLSAGAYEAASAPSYNHNVKKTMAEKDFLFLMNLIAGEVENAFVVSFKQVESLLTARLLICKHNQ